MNRTIIVGDVHGNYDEACRLLELCGLQGGDRTLFVGDMVDRGPHSDMCLNLAMSLERQQNEPACVRGNHEDQHLRYNDVERNGGTPDVVSPTHRRTREQLAPAHYEYMRGMPLYVRLPEHGSVVVHAGVYPGRTIEQQSSHHLMHAMMLAPHDDAGRPTGEERTRWPSPTPEPADGLRWRYWTHFWDGPERVIFGHVYTDVPLVTDHAVGLDGGCCFGGELRALILPDARITTVRAGSPAPAQNIRRSTGRTVERYEIHPGVHAFS